jgi:hypothetical protein
VRGLRTRVIPTAVLAGLVLLAAFVFHEQPPAAWLRVDAPTAVVVGQPFVATVTLTEPMDGVFLDFDLHGQDAKKKPLRCVAAGKSQAVSAGTRTYTFTLVLRDRPDVERAHAVIYLSTTGQWRDCIRSVRSDPIRVVRGVATAEDARIAELVVRDQLEDPAIEIPNPPAARAAIALIWFIGAVLAGLAWRRGESPRGVPVLPMLFLAIALWEATDAGAWIESSARSLVQSADLYEERRGFQQVATLAAALCAGALAVLGLRRTRRRVSGLTVAAVSIYGAVELGAMLSLHEIDRVLAASWGPVCIAIVLRALAACIAAAGIAHRLATSPR